MARLLATALGIAPSAVSVVKGLQGRTKIVEVAGLSLAEIESRLAPLVSRAS